MDENLARYFMPVVCVYEGVYTSESVEMCIIYFMKFLFQ